VGYSEKICRGGNEEEGEFSDRLNHEAVGKGLDCERINEL
jgi:hypothetical protein